VTDDKPLGTQVQQWVSFGASIIAPVTVISAVLFYFGYVSSRSEYGYFGIDVDTIGLSTQGYVMRSPQVLLVPLLVLGLVGAGLLVINSAVRGRVALALNRSGESQDQDDQGAGSRVHFERIRRNLRRTAIVGLVILVAGIVLLFAYPYLRSWSPYPLVTPLVIAIGAALAAYAWSLGNFVRRIEPEPTVADLKTGGPGGVAARPADPALLARRTAAVLICVVIAASLFWATATIAQWTGRGLAEYQARHLDSLPSVILDTKERLFLRDPGITETLLPASDGQTFHYRYRGLRLLIDGQDRLFLVPDQWSASDSTLVVPLDESVRVQFQFENQPP
jgi:hypothetical protein